MNFKHNKILEDDISKFWLDEHGIMCNEIKHEIDLNVKNCSKFINLRHEFSNGEKQYWLYDFNNIKSMPSEGKEYADRYGQEFLYACAGLVHNHFQKYIVNIFISIKKPKVPFRAFTDRNEAIKWLLKHKAKNESRRD